MIKIMQFPYISICERFGQCISGFHTCRLPVLMILADKNILLCQSFVLYSCQSQLDSPYDALPHQTSCKSSIGIFVRDSSLDPCFYTISVILNEMNSSELYDCAAFIQCYSLYKSLIGGIRNVSIPRCFGIEIPLSVWPC